MKVWHGFTLVLWTILLQVCFTIVLLHFALQGSVLDSTLIKERVASSNAYDIVRDVALTDRVTASLEARYPDNQLLDKTMIADAMQQAFPRAEIQKRAEPVIDVVYEWLDSKRPDITFEVPIDDRHEQFYTALETSIGKKLATLPTCTTYRYSIEDSLLQDGCLPSSISTADATQAIMGLVRSQGSPIGGSITAETVSIPTEQLRPLKQVLTYLNYFWALNYLLLGIAVLAILFLLIVRRFHGVVAIGIATLLAGLSVWMIQGIITTAVKPQSDPFIGVLQNIFIPAFTSLASHYSFLVIGGGVVIISLAAAWSYWRRRRHA